MAGPFDDYKVDDKTTDPFAEYKAPETINEKNKPSNVKAGDDFARRYWAKKKPEDVGVLDWIASPAKSFEKTNPEWAEMYRGHGGAALGIPVAATAGLYRSGAKIADKAITDTIKGVTSFFPDVSDAVGLTDKLGPRVRDAMPDRVIPKSMSDGLNYPGGDREINPVEDFVATLVQFGIPAGSAYKLAHKFIPAATNKTSRMGHIMRGEGGIAAASGADVVVSNPEDDKPAVLGDNDDTPLATRAKIGAEGGILSQLGLPLSKGAEIVGNAFKSKGESEIKKIVGRHFVGEDLEGDLNVAHKAIADKNIDQYLADKAAGKFSPGFAATSGAAMNTGRGAAIDRGAIQSEIGGDIIGNQRNDNMLAVSKDLRDNALKPGTDSQALRTFMTGENQKPIDEATAALTEAEKRLLDLDNADIDTMLAEARANQGRGEADASKEIDKVVRETWKNKAAERRTKMESVDPEQAIEIDRDELEALLKDLTTDKYPKDEAASTFRNHPIIEHLMDRINHIKEYEKQAADAAKMPTAPTLEQEAKDFMARKEAEAGGAPKEPATPPKPITYGEINQFWEPVMNAMKANEGSGARESFKTFRNYLIDQAHALQLSDNPEIAARALAAAKANAEYTDLFRKYAGDEFVGAQKGTIGSEPTATAGIFIRSGEKGTEEGAQQLKAMLAGKSDAEVRKVLLDRFVGTGDVKDITPKQIDKFLNDNRIVLDVFDPDNTKLRGELLDLRKNLSFKASNKTPLQQELSAAQRKLADVKIDQAGQPSTKFRNANAENAVRSLMEGADPKGAAENLAALARDGGPEMVNNLKGVLGKYIVRKVNVKTKHTLAASSVDNQAAVKIGAVHDLLEGKPELKEGLEQIYGKNSQEMKALQRVWNSLDVSDRINKQHTGNSSTPEMLADANNIRALVTSAYGIIRGNAIVTMTRTGMKLAGASPDEVAGRILAQAVSDPVFAKELMDLATKPEPTKFRKFLMNNVIGEIANDDEVKGSGDTPEAPGGAGDDILMDDQKLRENDAADTLTRRMSAAEQQNDDARRAAEDGLKLKKANPKLNDAEIEKRLKAAKGFSK